MLIQAGRVQEGIEVAQRIVEHEDWNVQVNRFIELRDGVLWWCVCVCGSLEAVYSLVYSLVYTNNQHRIRLLSSLLPSRPIIL